MSDDENEDELLNIFTECKQQILQELRLFLVKDIEPQKLYASLRSRGVFDEDDQEEIEYDRLPRKKRAERFLDTISRKGDAGFDAFCQCIVEQLTGQLHLLKKILTVFESKIQGAEELQHTRKLTRIPPMLMMNNFPSPGQMGGPELPEGYFGRYMSEPPPSYAESTLKYS
eukprot:TCONS_00011127-protein